MPPLPPRHYFSRDDSLRFVAIRVIFINILRQSRVSCRGQRLDAMLTASRAAAKMAERYASFRHATPRRGSDKMLRWRGRFLRHADTPLLRV